MEVYVLDELLRRIEVIDLFESCIWTDRFALSGDIELVVEGNQHYRRTLKEGVYLACNESDRVMRIETVERTQDDQDRKMIKIKGVSAEKFFLDNRVVIRFLGALGDTPNWSFNKKPAEIARQLFDDICVKGDLTDFDKMPFYVAGNTYPTDTILEPAEKVNYEVKPGSLYEALANLCAAYDLGFRIVRNQDWSQLRFNVYTGNDRTTRQSGVPAVVFSSNMDNLSGINEFESSDGYKNCALVSHKDLPVITVYSKDVDSSVAGFERRSIFVDGNSIDPDLTGSDQLKALRDLGQVELAKRGRLAAFDGEVSQFGAYKEGVDYFLGDLVEIQSETGANSIMRVTEQIYASDAQGDRSYPTLSISKYTTPGSWGSWDFAQTWSEALPVWRDA